MTITPGVLVEHPVWGRGKVLEIAPPSVTVHFPSLANDPKGPLRRLLLGAPQLTISDTQSDPALDDVVMARKPAKAKGKAPRKAPTTVHSLDYAIEWFEEHFPGRFADPRLIHEELGYKRDAHDLFVSSFGEGKGEELLASKSFAEISEGLNRVFHATNIPSRYEQIATNDGLKDLEAAARLLKGILAFVDSADAVSFDGLIDALAALPKPPKGSRVVTWPNLTIQPFLAAPHKCMVLKPDTARRAAARMHVDLLYSSTPKWHTYNALMAMSLALRDRLQPLGARDFIDVQSFMWVTRHLP